MPLSSKATLAVQWIRRRWLERPTTRAYIDGQQSRDWRNSVSFSFDQIMMLRGVYATAALVDSGLLRPLLADLCRRLGRFIGEDGLLLPCLATGSGTIPERWSTRQGPYQMKAAAALLAMSPILTPPLQMCGWETCNSFASFAPEVIATEELHPLLYFGEGLLLAWAATGEHRFLSHAQLILGRILEHLGEVKTDTEYFRSDVIAQTLRAACLLGNSNTKQLRTLAGALVQFMGPNGAVYFRRHPNGQLQHANVWCSIFAAQALHNYSRILRHGSVSSSDIAFLV